MTPRRPAHHGADRTAAVTAAGAPPRPRVPGPPAGRPSGSAPGAPTSGSRKARLRCTGPGPPVPERPRRRPGRPADRHARPAGVVGDAGVGEPPHRPPVQVGLVDGLRRPDVVQLGRSVGRADDQRHAGVVGLDHRRVQLGGRRAAGRADDGRTPDAQARPRAKKPALRSSSRTCSGDRRTGGQGQGQRRRARAGADHGVGQPGPDPLVDQGGGEGGLQVADRYAHRTMASLHRRAPRRPGPPLVLAHGFTQTGRLWGPFGDRLAGHPSVGPSTCPATAGPRPSSPTSGRWGRLWLGGRRRRAVRPARLLARGPGRPARRPGAARPARAGWCSSGPPPASRTTSPGERRRRRRRPGRRARAVGRRGRVPALAGWRTPCSPTCRRRQPGWTSGGGTRRPGWPRACGWPAPAPRSRCGTAWTSWPCPSLVVAGAADPRFGAPASRMARALPHGALVASCPGPATPPTSSSPR